MTDVRRLALNRRLTQLDKNLGCFESTLFFTVLFLVHSELFAQTTHFFVILLFPFIILALSGVSTRHRNLGQIKWLPHSGTPLTVVNDVQKTINLLREAVHFMFCFLNTHSLL